MVINHTDCGLMHTTEEDLRTRIQNRAGTAADRSARFSTPSRTSRKMCATSCRNSARIRGFRQASLIRGFVYDVASGRLREVTMAGTGAHAASASDGENADGAKS